MISVVAGTLQDVLVNTVHLKTQQSFMACSTQVALNMYLLPDLWGNTQPCGYFFMTLLCNYTITLLCGRHVAFLAADLSCLFWVGSWFTLSVCVCVYACMSLHGCHCM